jgi:butyryl-CoA dehydrogenase
MDFSLNDEQKMLVETLKTMGVREKFKERAMEIDRTGEFPHDLLAKYGEMGLLGMTLSPQYGGGGQPAINAILAIEELAKYSPMIASPVFESNVGPVRVIDLFGTEEQKKTIIPGVCAGKNSVSVCMTEPEAGSDLTSLATKAVEDGDSYILNGRKVFITGGGHASHYMVYSR